MNDIKEHMDGISVIIPVYNTAPYLRRCLNSIIQNTYKKLEIICVNDGSTDESLKILEEYAELDERIKIINKNINQGVSAARNTGLEMASKEWIAFIDSDDWIHYQYFERLVAAGASDCVVVACNTDIIHLENQANQTAREPIRTKEINVEQFLTSGYKCMVTAKIYEREKIQNIRFNPEISLGEDTMFNVEASLSFWGKNIAVIEIPLYYYFKRDDSITNKINLPDFKPLIEKYSLLLQDNCKDDLLKRIYTIETLKILLNYRYSYMYEENYSEVKKYCKNKINFCWKCLKEVKFVSAKEYIKYYILISFPVLYRLFRIVTDRTMLKWEREQKKNRKMKTKCICM